MHTNVEPQKTIVERNCGPRELGGTKWGHIGSYRSRKRVMRARGQDLPRTVRITKDLMDPTQHLVALAYGSSIFTELKLDENAEQTGGQ